MLFRFWVFPDCTFLDISTCEVRLKEGSGAKSAGAFLNLSKNHKITSTNIAKKLLLQRCSKPLFSAFFNFSHKRPTFAFTSKSGYTLAFANRIAHSGLHAETGAIQMGALLLPSDCFTRFRNPAWPGGRTANFAAFGSWSEALLKDAKSLGTAMRLCASLSRGVAAPLGCVIFFHFCRNCGLYALRSGPFRVCEARGGITTLSALYVLLKRRTAACQNGSFAVF